jgi:OOP family OmpA-OmpF porin
MKKLAVAIGFMTLSASAFAQGTAPGNFYMGLSAGQTNVDTGIGGTTGTASLDETDTGFKIFAGVKIDNIWSAELQYADFGKISLKGNSGDTFTYQGEQYQFTANNAELSLKATSFGGAIVAGYDVSKVVRPFAKIGLHRWDSEASESSTAGSGSLSDSGTDIFYGVGVQFSLTNQISVRLEAEEYKFDDEKARLVSIGFAYQF